MSDTVDVLLFDMLEWISREERLYPEVMEVWRTSCPRLAVWEEATDRGLVQRHYRENAGQVVLLTEAGRDFVKWGRNRRAGEG